MNQWDPDGTLRERYILVVEPDKVVTVKRDGRIKRDDEAFETFLREVIRYYPNGRHLVVELPESGGALWVTEASEWLFNQGMWMDPLAGEDSP